MERTGDGRTLSGTARRRHRLTEVVTRCLDVTCTYWCDQGYPADPSFTGLWVVWSGWPLLLLQRSTAVQVRSSVRLMPQNQPSGRGLLPSPTAWSPDQHHAAMLADASRHILGRTEGRGLGFGQLVLLVIVVA